eukprot:TRINITY_DN28101_c0_g1_i1.p1 TRINITY_DN28101_c0_g1~~TRINITY_DN28101_c0_g1_i1.p1  ORF type:complete len:492 (+),score=69.72 TRINITY_DN28101_c0_g1_i1:150-1625(+)
MELDYRTDPADAEDCAVTSPGRQDSLSSYHSSCPEYPSAALESQEESVIEGRTEIYASIKKKLKDNSLHRVRAQLKERLNFNFPCISETIVFQNCSTEFKTTLAMVAKQKFFDVGQDIFRVNDIADSMYIIHIGSVDVIVDGDRISTTLEAGDIFGEVAARSTDVKEARRSATVRVRNFCDCRVVSRPALMRIIRCFPQDASGMVALAQARHAETTGIFKMLNPTVALNKMKTLSWPPKPRTSEGSDGGARLSLSFGRPSQTPEFRSDGTTRSDGGSRLSLSFGRPSQTPEFRADGVARSSSRKHSSTEDSEDPRSETSNSLPQVPGSPAAVKHKHVSLDFCFDLAMSVQAEERSAAGIQPSQLSFDSSAAERAFFEGAFVSGTVSSAQTTRLQNVGRLSVLANTGGDHWQSEQRKMINISNGVVTSRTGSLVSDKHNSRGTRPLKADTGSAHGQTAKQNQQISGFVNEPSRATPRVNLPDLGIFGQRVRN